MMRESGARRKMKCDRKWCVSRVVEYVYFLFEQQLQLDRQIKFILGVCMQFLDFLELSLTLIYGVVGVLS